MSTQNERNWKEEAATDIRRYINGYQRNPGGDVPNSKTLSHEAAKRIREYNSLIAVQDTELLWAYHSDGIWRDDGKQQVRWILVNGFSQHFSKRLLSEVCERIKAWALLDRDKLGPPTGHIALHNGLLELETGDIRSLERSDYTTWRLPVTYNPEAECPRFIEFLKDVCPDKKIPVLQEYAGYCLNHNTANRKKALMLLGPTDAGKSVLLDVISALFGKDNVTTLSPQYLGNQRWGVHHLEQKPVNIRHDIEESRIDRIGPLKELIAGNTMLAEQKFEDPYEVNPYTKFLFSGNQAPKVDGDQAFWNRWLTVRFPEQIPPEEQDVRLTEKLTDELPGVLNWALAGYRRLENQGGFSSSLSAEKNKQHWRAYGSSVDRFGVSCLKVTGDMNDFEAKEDVYEAYSSFASDRNLTVETKSTFTSELKNRDGIDDGKRRISGEPSRVYMGVQLNSG